MPPAPAFNPQHSTTPCAASIDDLRFRNLISDAAWERLPHPVRRRFSKRVAGGGSVVYVGEITEASRNLAGRCLAEVLRLIGAPLPLSAATGLPSVVSVTEDRSGGGQNWTRIQGTTNGFPQVVHSAKRFSGPTGLEEYLSKHISMALRIEAEARSLVFRSDHIAFHIGGRRLRLPRLLSPGELTVRHREIGAGRFSFSMTLVHPLLGQLIHQSGIYREERQ
ncbi:MAG: DUF4166 domain-containing protein [Pseudomonadota bacterium]